PDLDRTTRAEHPGEEREERPLLLRDLHDRAITHLLAGGHHQVAVHVAARDRVVEEVPAQLVGDRDPLLAHQPQPPRRRVGRRDTGAGTGTPGLEWSAIGRGASVPDSPASSGSALPSTHSGSGSSSSRPTKNFEAM